jgi:hypothetical protein
MAMISARKYSSRPQKQKGGQLKLTPSHATKKRFLPLMTINFQQDRIVT